MKISLLALILALILASAGHIAVAQQLPAPPAMPATLFGETYIMNPFSTSLSVSLRNGSSPWKEVQLKPGVRLSLRFADRATICTKDRGCVQRDLVAGNRYLVVFDRKKGTWDLSPQIPD